MHHTKLKGEMNEEKKIEIFKMKKKTQQIRKSKILNDDGGWIYVNSVS